VNNFFLIFSLITNTALACAADKPTIYNFATDESAEIDREVRKLLSPKFTVVDIRDATKYVQPKSTAGTLPHTALAESGKQLGGCVLVAYIVTIEGRAAEPHILKSTDQRLNSIALRAMDEWCFTPATLNGVTIASTAAQEFNFEVEVAPTEFVTQVLEPTGGKISRPKGWFYTESHRGSSYTWILSREDASKARYTTGVRIQTLVGVKKGTGKTPKEFTLDFLAAKNKEAAKVIKTFAEKDEDLFMRVGVETEEGPDHILYSLFWGKNIDVVVVSIAGTTKELWETYSATFNKMGSFELIDMKRFEK